MHHKEAVTRNKVKKAEKTLRNYENDKTISEPHRKALVIAARVDLEKHIQKLRLVLEDSHAD